MRIWLKILLLVSSVMIGNAQNFQHLDAYLQTSWSTNDINAQDKIQSLIDRIGPNLGKSDRHFLRQVFYITHRQVLKHYDQYSEFGELFSSGRYDCLTATALYSLLLTHYGYPHQVIETNFHIFLLVQSNDGTLLIESTDPLDGFEFQKEKINNRISQYLTDQEAAIANMQHPISYSIFNEVSRDQLTGLLYYNQCVNAFNEQRWNDAISLLDESKRYYQSPRIVEMENILFSVLASIEIEKAKTSADNLSPAVGQLAMRNP